MSEYVICMDASGDITREIAGEGHVEFVPMEYSLGEEMRTSRGCEEDELLKKFYDGQRSGDLTRTSQVSPFMYEEYFKKFMEEGKSVLYFCLSSGLSATYESAVLAGKNLEEAYPGQKLLPVDTLAATGGIGILVEKAIENQKAGMTLQENFDAVKSLVPLLHHFFLVQDLMYLKRGGRVGAATAIVGSALNIKPILKIDEMGKLVTIDKKRGNKTAMMALLSYFKEKYNPEAGETVYICDADTPLLAAELEEKVKEAAPAARVRRTMLSPIIGAHTGPGMLSVIFLGQ